MPQDIQQNIKVEVTSSGIEGAISSLERLQRTIRSCTSGVSSIKTSLNSIGKTSTSGISSMSNTMSKEFRKISMEAVNTKQIIEKSLSNINVSAYGMMNANGKGGVTRKVSNDGINAAGNSARNADEALAKFADRFDEAGSAAEDASWNFFRTRAILTAMVFGLAELGSGLVAWYKLASDYAEANHLLYTNLADSMRDVADAEKTAEVQALDLFGNATDQALKTTEAVATTVNELRDMQAALGIDPTNLNRTFATFYSMGNSAGMVSEELAKVSQGMTQLTYDMASLWDMPFAEVAGKLQSALAGNTTAVKSLGIDISRTAADAWLMANGIDASYNSLDRASKMIVIYNMLMENTTAAQGDLARSAMQPANMLRILGEQATIAARNLGGALFPILTQLIPIAVAIAHALGQAATALASFLGVQLGASYTESFDSWNDYMNGLSGSASTASADVASAGAAVASVGDAASSAAAPLSTLSSGLSTADASMLSVGDGAEAAMMSLDNFSSSMEDVGASASMLSVDEPMNSLTDMSNTIQDISASPLSIDETHAVSPLETVTGAAEDTLDTLNEIKNFQLGFDELHVMPEATETGGSSGGGGGGAGTGDGGGGSGIVAIDPYEMDDSVLQKILEDARQKIEALKQAIDDTFGEGTWAQIETTATQVLESIKANFDKLKTAAGALALAFIGLFNWPELIKGFGDGFSAALTAITDFVTWIMYLVAAFLQLEPVKKFFQDMSYDIGYVIGVVAALALTVGGAGLAFKTLGIFFSPLVGMFKLALSPLTGLVKLLFSIPSAVLNASKAFGEIKAAVEIFNGGFAAVGTKITEFNTKLGAIRTAISTVIMDLRTTPGGFIEWYNNGIAAIVGKIDGFILKITGIGGVMTKILTPIGNAIINAFSKVGNLFWDVGLKLEGLAGKFSFLKPIVEPVASLFEKIGLKLVGFSNPVTIAINALLLLAQAFMFVYDNSETFRQTVSLALEGVTQMFGQVVGWLQPFIDSLVEAFNNLIGKITGVNPAVNSFSEAWEAVKNALVAILEPILTPLTIAFSYLGQIIVAVAGIISGVLLAAITIIINMISGLVTVIQGVITMFSGLADIITGVLTGDLDKAVQGLDTFHEGFNQFFTGIGEIITGFIDGALTALGDALGIDLSGVLEGAIQAFTDFGDFLSGIFAPKTAEAAELTDQNFQTIEDSAETHADNAESEVSGAWDTLKTNTETKIGEIETWLGETWGNIESDIKTKAEGAKDKVKTAWDTLKTNTETVIGNVKTWMSDTWTNIKDYVSTNADTAQSDTNTAWGKIKTATDTILSPLDTAIDTLWDTIKGHISDNAGDAADDVDTEWGNIETYTGDLDALKQTVSDIFGGVYTNISTEMDNITKKVQDAWKTVTDTLSSIGSAIGDAVSSVGSKISDAMSRASAAKANAVAQATQAAQNAASGRSAAAPMSVDAAPDMGWYAKGGIFNAPSVIGVGEAGDEAVVPLTGARMRPFAQAIASELRVSNSKADVSRTNDSAFINAVSTAVYNAMINGFPSEIKSDVYMDSEKVGKALRKTDRQRGVGTSLVRSV